MVYLAALYCLLKQAQNAATNTLSSNDPYSPWHSGDAWRLNEPSIHRLTLNINEQIIDVCAEQLPSKSSSRFAMTIDTQTRLAQGVLTNNTLHAVIDGHQSRVTVSDTLTDTVAGMRSDYQLFTDTQTICFKRVLPDLGEVNDTDVAGGLAAPMNGTLVTLLVDVDTVVKKGDALVVMEAMKMEHTIYAPHNGTVTEFYFQPGNLVDGGAELLNFAAEA